jgi:hypothetical protein
MADTELQTDQESESLETGAESETAEEEVTEQQEAGGEEAEGQEGKSDGEGAPEGSPDDPAGFTKAINRKHFEKMEETRRADAAEEQLRILQSQIPQAQKPVVPDLPDPYDVDFDPKMAARDQAVKDAATFDANQAAAFNQQQQANQQAINAQNEVVRKTEQDFVDRSAGLGINNEDLGVALQTVSAYGGVGGVSEYIMADDQGPLITAFLAKNPGEVANLRALPPMQAAAHIAMNIKPKLGTIKKTTGAPAPVDGVDGGGAPPAKRGPKGATYE